MVSPLVLPGVGVGVANFAYSIRDKSVKFLINFDSSSADAKLCELKQDGHSSYLVDGLYISFKQLSQ